MMAFLLFPLVAVIPLLNQNVHPLPVIQYDIKILIEKDLSVTACMQMGRSWGERNSCPPTFQVDGPEHFHFCAVATLL